MALKDCLLPMILYKRKEKKFKEQWALKADKPTDPADEALNMNIELQLRMKEDSASLAM